MVDVVQQHLAAPGVTVREFGHGTTYHAKTRVDQSRTGAWWENGGQLVCRHIHEAISSVRRVADGRSKYGQAASAAEMDVNEIIGDAFVPGAC